MGKVRICGSAWRAAFQVVMSGVSMRDCGGFGGRGWNQVQGGAVAREDLDPEALKSGEKMDDYKTPQEEIDAAKKAFKNQLMKDNKEFEAAAAAATNKDAMSQQKAALAAAVEQKLASKKRALPGNLQIRKKDTAAELDTEDAAAEKRQRGAVAEAIAEPGASEGAAVSATVNATDPPLSGGGL